MKQGACCIQLEEVPWVLVSKSYASAWDIVGLPFTQSMTVCCGGGVWGAPSEKSWAMERTWSVVVNFDMASLKPSSPTTESTQCAPRYEKIEKTPGMPIS